MPRSSLILSLLVLAAAGLALWLVARHEPGGAGGVAAPAATASKLDSPTEPRGLVASVPDAEGAREEARSDAVDPVDPGPVQAAAVPALAPAIIRGRLFDPEGEPAGGVLLRLGGWGAYGGDLEERLRESGVEPETLSADDGRFEIRFPPPAGFMITLGTHARGYAKAYWDWETIAPGEIVDVGDVTLAVAGALRVRIVDASGLPMAGEWHVFVVEERRSVPEGRPHAWSFGDADPSTGVAFFDDLPAGRFDVSASWAPADDLDRVEVVVEAGETKEVELRYSGSDPFTRIVVLAGCASCTRLEPAEGAIVLRGQGIERRSGRGQYELVFDDLPPGTYSIQLEDEQFEPWSAAAVQGGETVVAQLRGSASVVVNPVDAQSGRALERYALSTLPADRFMDLPYPLQELDAEPPPGGIFQGVCPVSQTLIVEAPGYASLELPIVDLGPGERRTLEARLWRALRVTGEVVHADGRPAPAAVVQLVPPGAGLERPSEGSERTDDAGRFVLEGLAPGTFDLHAYANPWLVATIEGIVLTAGSSLEDLRVELPPSARVRGRVLAPPDARDEELILSFRPAGEPAFDNRDGNDAPAVQVPIAPGRSFDSGPLPPSKLEILLWREIGPMDALGWVATRETLLQALELEPGEVAEVDLDLSALWPARLTVRLQGMDEQRAGDYRVLALRERSSLNELAAEEWAREDGTAELGPLDPGPYWVSAFVMTGPGSWSTPTPVVLEPGAQSEVDLPVHLAKGEVVLLRGVDGPPLAGTRLAIVGDFVIEGVSVETDEEGRLRLEIPPGSYTLSLWGERGAGLLGQATLEWSAAGPVTSHVVLEAR